MMPTMPPDTHKISLKIIEAIKQHPVLYINDVKGTSIKVQEFRQKVWKRISDELTLDPGWMRLRWKNLRDTYCRILKYKNKTDKGVRRKKWIFEDHLGFLKFPYEADYQPQCVELTEEYIRDINSGSMETEGLLEQLEDREDDDYSEYLEVLEETSADPVPENSESTEDFDNVGAELAEWKFVNDRENGDESRQRVIESKYRKIRPKRMKIDDSTMRSETSDGCGISKSKTRRAAETKNTNIMNSISSAMTVSDDPSRETIARSNDINENNSTQLFFDSMARTVKLLPLEAQVDIKMAVCKIVTEAEMRYFKSSENTQRFVTPPGMIPKLVLVPCSMIDNPRD